MARLRHAIKHQYSEFVEWELVKSVYNQLPSLLIGGSAVTAGAVIAWVETHNGWFLLWSIVSAVVTIGRIVLNCAFDRGRSTAAPASARVWRDRFTLGAWALGVVLGVSGCGVVLPLDAFSRLLLTAIQAVTLMGAVTRNAGCSRAAKGQILLAICPVVIACVIVHDRQRLIFLAFLFFELAGALGTVRYLHRQMVRLLESNEANIKLASVANSANAELAAVNLRLEEVALTDGLTGIANRRRFDQVLGEEVRRAQRDGSELSLLMLDIDFFKQFNDQYGHVAGDDCLQRVAHAIHDGLRRPGDLVARYGGEEFGTVLPQMDSAAATALARLLCERIAALAIPSAASDTGIVTVSVGVAMLAPGSSSRPADLVQRADEALYAAKAGGRNCVRFATSPVVTV